MASKYVSSLNGTLTPAVGDQPIASQSSRGMLRYIDELYEMDGTESDADVIYIARLYAGEKVLAQLSDIDIEVDLAGASTTLNIGDTDGSGDQDRYATVLDASAAARVAFDETHKAAEHVITEDCWLTAKFAVINTPAAAGQVRFRVVVRMP